MASNSSIHMDTEPGFTRKDTRRRESNELNQKPGIKMIRVLQLQTIEIYSAQYKQNNWVKGHWGVCVCVGGGVSQNWQEARGSGLGRIQNAPKARRYDHSLCPIMGTLWSGCYSWDGMPFPLLFFFFLFRLHVPLFKIQVLGESIYLLLFR